MNYSEMLHDFLDSSLNGSGEETLFRALAADEELRFEMKYLLKLRDAVGEDDEAYVVPVASTNAIFAQLGYTAPAALVGAAGGIAGAQSGLLTLLKSAGGYLLASIVGALVTTGIFMLNDSPDTTTIATAERTPAGQVQSVPGASAAASPSTSAATQGTQNPNGSANAGAAVNLQERSGGTQAGQSTVNAGAAQRPPAQNNPNASTSQKDGGANTNTLAAATDHAAKTADTKEKSSEEEGTKQPAAAVASGSARIDSLTIGAVKEDPMADPESTIGKLSTPTTEEHSSKMDLPAPFELEKPKPWREPTFTVAVRAAVLPFELKSPNTTLPETSAGLDNITAGFAYPLPFYRNFSIVAEGGKESYLLTFNEKRSDGRVFQHEVMPSVFWAGVGGRFNLAPQSWLNPFAQVIVGGSEAGMIGRGMLGTQVSLNDQIGMMFGLEYNLAMYRFQGETTASPKLGLNYGLTFNLFGN